MKKKIIAMAVAAGIVLNAGMPVFAASPSTTTYKNAVSNYTAGYDTSSWGSWGNWGSESGFGGWNWGSGNWNWGTGSGGNAPVEEETFALDTPVLGTTRFIHQSLYSPDVLSLDWNDVEGAVSYEVEITHGDTKVYTTDYSGLGISANRGDSFVSGCMRGAKVRVRAVDKDGNFSDWSKEGTVGCNKFH